MSPETKELTVSPASGLAPNITPAALRSPPAVTLSAAAMQPMVQFGSQLFAILSDIDATPSPFASPDAAHEQPVCASPLTERALRYQRREASRTGRSTVVLTPLSSPIDSPRPLDDFRAETYYQYRLLSTPARLRESLNCTIPGNISSPGPEQYRSTPNHSQSRKPFAHSTPATFPLMTQALHMAEQCSFSSGFCCPPRAFPRHDLSRAPRSMSSPTTTSPASKTIAKGLRPSADTNAHLQGTSSPVTSSTLRAVSGSGSDRTHGLRPDAPVSPRALLGDPRGPSAHLRYLQPVWASMEPTFRARIGSISIQDVEASHALTGTATDGDEPARKAADACTLSVAEEEHALAIHPLQARAAALDCEHANLWGRLRHLETERRSNAAEIVTAERRHQTFASNIGAGPRQPLPARAATRPAAPATSVTFSAPTAPQWRHTADPAPQQHQAPTTAAGSTAPTAATDRLRAVHYRRPLVRCRCAPPPAAPTNSTRRPLLGPPRVHTNVRQ